VTFLLAVIISNLLAILLLVFIKTVAFINVVKYYSVRVMLISSSRGCNASRCLPEP
jgi:hypothetical protein